MNAWVSGGLVPAAVRGSKMSHFMHISDWCESILRLHAGLPTAHCKATRFVFKLQGRSFRATRTSVPVCWCFNIVVFCL